MGQPRHHAERVNLLKKIQVAGGWKFAPVVERNGKILRDRVLARGYDEQHPEGSYYAEWHEAGERSRKAVGKFDAALDAARRKSLELKALPAGLLQPQPRHSPKQERLTIGAAIDSYLDFVDHHPSPAFPAR